MSLAQTWADRLTAAGVGPKPMVQPRELAGMIGDVSDLAPALAEGRAQKAAMVWVKAKLDADPAFNHRFKDRTDLPWLDKLLTVARVRELAAVKIVKAGKSSGLRYNVSGLRASWYGRRILQSVGFAARRTSATKAEFAQIREACARIKLKLPESVEPTTTERFFEGFFEAEEPK